MSEALTKAAMIELAHDKLGLPNKKCSEMVEIFLDIIKSTLASGEDVLISGFGKFSVNHKNERKGRNPATDEGMILPARRVVTFKSSGKLRNKLNGG
jgi:integration host factor subunit alpha